MKTLIINLLILTWASFAFAQGFTDVANDMDIAVFVNNNIYGAGVSGADFDGDGLDDLTFCTHQEVIVYRNTGSGFDELDVGVGFVGPTKHPVWVDYDNDGDRDLFCTRYQSAPLLIRNDGNLQFTDVSEDVGFDETNPPHYGCSWGDYDRDGDLDVFICSYVYIYDGENPYQYYNHLYQNNGNGTFSDVTESAGVSDGISLSFQSVWMDYDNDLWPDLYVINDLEHSNRLYHNNQDGTFSEITEESGTGVWELDAMCATCGDFNRDGWEDIYITNTTLGPPVLLANNGDGTFSDQTSETGVDQIAMCWAGNWIDYDLDADLDLHVCEHFPNFPGLPNLFYENDGLGNYVEIATALFPFDFSDSHASAQCDWNQDGLPDLAVNNYNLQNANLWQNSGDPGNFVSVELQGVLSNSDGVGSKIELWSNGHYQSAYTYCGQDYLGQQSFSKHFGLGESTGVDSIQISWPSGHEDFFYDLESGFHQLVEGEGIIATGNNSDVVILCADATLTLLAAEGYDSYLWNTGADSSSIEVDEPGAYWVEIISADSLVFVDTLYVSPAPETEITISASNPTCWGMNDGQITVSAENATVSQFCGTEFFEVICTDLPGGIFPYNLTDKWGCYYSGIVVIQDPEPIAAALTTDDVSCYGLADGSVDISPEGGTPPLIFDIGENDPDSLSAGSYVLAIVDSLGCEETFFFEILQPDSLWLQLVELDCGNGLMSVDIETNGGTPPYSYDWSNGQSDEDLSGVPLEILSVTVTDDNECEQVLSDIECVLSASTINSPIFQAYPNPIDDVLIINSTAPIMLKLIDDRGRVLRHVAVTEDSVTLSLPELSPGMYTLTDGKGTSLSLMKK